MNANVYLVTTIMEMDYAQFPIILAYNAQVHQLTNAQLVRIS